MSGQHVRIVDPGAVPGWRSYLELTKPRIIELLLVTTVPAMVVAEQGWPSTWLVIATVIGGTLSAAGANAINQVFDRDIDAMMSRTRNRPIPSGRVTPRSAMWFGVLLGISGFVWLWVTSNLLAGALSSAGLLFYVFVYTMVLKRSSTQNIVVGGAAGAVPTLVGWAAVTGSLSATAWAMFAVVFFWTPAHFWALSLRYRDDYKSAGVPMLPVVVGERDTLEQIVRYSIVTVGVSLLLVAAGPALGWLYVAVAALLGVMLMQRAAALRKRPADAMGYFTFTNLYLGGLFVAMALDAMLVEPVGPVAATVVGIAGAILALGGGALIVHAELTMEGRRLVTPLRDTVEVVVPLVALMVVVVAVLT